MKRKIIIDCDPGIDDALAILLALNSPELEVVAITIVCGNVPTELGVKNASKILWLADRKNIPIYCGETSPQDRPLITAQDTHGMDGLGETNFTELPYLFIKNNAVDFLIESASQDMHLVALGPYSNLRRAFEKDSKKMNRYGSIFSMGGNYRAQGNCSAVAEYNFWVDPEAADFVFKSIDEPITLLGLDVTRQIVLTPHHRQWLAGLDNPVAKFIYDITQFYVDFHLKQEGLAGCVINDPLVIAYLLFPEMGTGISAHLNVVCKGENMGQSVIDPDHQNHNVYMLTKINSNFFFRLFFERVIGATTPPPFCEKTNG